MRMTMSALDRLYLARAYELAARGIGNVSPNPPVGAVIVRDGQTLGEGFHHQRGGPHAEIMALRDAQARGFGTADFAGATMYVSLEPCNHHGRTPPCSEAVRAAGFMRVVIGTLDPNPRTARGGVAVLEAARIAVDIACDAAAEELIAPFAAAMRNQRPYVTLKLAASLNGAIAPEPGRYWLTGDAARRFVRELRTEHDLVLVGAGTLRVDNPDLRPRPARTRLRPVLRAIVCGLRPPPADSRVFLEDGAQTWLIVPLHMQHAYGHLRRAHVEIVPVTANEHGHLDLHAMLNELGKREIGSVVCEGGPHLATALLRAGCVDRLEWLLAPALIAAPQALPVLDASLGILPITWDLVQSLGEDLRLSLSVQRNSVTVAETAA